MTENRPLRATAIIICILAILITTLSGLCSLKLMSDDPSSTLIYIAIGAIGFIPFGLLAFAMFWHIKRGSNLFSEIIAIIMGLLIALIFVVLMQRPVGSGIGEKILLRIPGLLISGWGIWSFMSRLSNSDSFP